MGRFSEEEVQRYARHIILQEVGGRGQEKIRDAKVFCVGAGGLGSPSTLYLAAAGVGTLGVIDSDVVDLSNLQRQVLHTTLTVDHPKVESARATLSAINPHVKLNLIHDKLTVSNIMDILREYDVILDGSDNFSTRYLVNDACFFLKKTLISGSIFRFEGQVFTMKAHQGHACYRCLYPEPPPAGMVPSCQEAGVLGVLAGTIGVLQATEALKEILGVGTSLADRLILYDALEMTFREVRVPKDPNCPLCGPRPTITTLTEYDEFCSL